MDPTIAIHNSHWDDPTGFPLLDPQLRRLGSQPLVHTPALLSRLPSDEPGIYTVGGARQVGKSTLVKQWMARLLEDGIPPRRIAYLTGELIDDHHALIRQVQELLLQMPSPEIGYLVVDEITYVREWDRAVKFLADAGVFDHVVLILTSSDLTLMQDARVRLPGRRGLAKEVDFHLFPLSFRETVSLKRGIDWTTTTADRHASPEQAEMKVLYEELDLYLRHGGFLTAINDVARTGFIEPATLRTYSDWIRGDMLKRGKREYSLREVLGSILTRQGSQVTWNAMARELSIDHPTTIQDYVDLLSRMDAVFVQHALREDKLAAAPKKARKVMFTDPFIGHAIDDWLNPSRDPYADRIVPRTTASATAAALIEAVTTTHFAREYPTFYLKGKGEVDIAYVSGRQVFPVEVKWTNQLRPQDFKEVARHPAARVFARVWTSREVAGVRVEPLPLGLLRIDRQGRLGT